MIIKLYVCLCCGELFEEPCEYDERHLEYPPYERWAVSPCCFDGYVSATKCSQCGDYIRDDYIVLSNGNPVCQNCYDIKHLDEGVSFA